MFPSDNIVSTGHLVKYLRWLIALHRISRGMFRQDSIVSINRAYMSRIYSLYIAVFEHGIL
jgi:hypothetical protein